jgi:hypothetical protein
MYYMLPVEFHTNIPSTISAELNINGLDRYCKLEGMDYQHLASEANKSRSLRNKHKYTVIEAQMQNQ